MPPKKKQQQIDLSTLPPCTTANAILFCKGKVQRSQKIKNRIFTDCKSLITKISKQEVLDHAKEKNIYVDPNTLNDKQKKDAKFMESICTQLTSEVIAKAIKSLIEQLNIKVRLELKAQNEKPQNQKVKSDEKKIDQIYMFDNFFESKSQFQALAAINQNIKYVIAINPVISWQNAPEIPQVQQQGQEPEQQQQEIKELRQLQSKQVLTPADQEHQKSVQSSLNQLKQFRKSTNRNSIFRDTIIEQLDCEIDPYNEQLGISQSTKNFISRINKLYLQYEQFLEWKKDKNPNSIMDQSTKQNEEIQKNKESHIKIEGSNNSQILSNFIDRLFSQNHSEENQQQDLQDLINNFNFNGKAPSKSVVQNYSKGTDKKSQFFNENENIRYSENDGIQQTIRSNLEFPGINRYLMPDIPLLSQPLRKLNRSQYVKFLDNNMPFSQFQRRLSIIKFQQMLKEVDEDRSYNLGDRSYEQYHDEKSLMRQLYRSMCLNQSHFISKYNEQNDQLYLALLYKNNQRRSHFKTWEANWKVLPNYQSWLKYFKENDTNFNTPDFYNIDYEAIGHINQKVLAYSIPDDGVLINKKAQIANNKNDMLYGIKNHHLFGIRQNTFYSQNKNIKIFHYPSQQNQYETMIQIKENITIRLKQSGDVIVQSLGQNLRMYTPDGYTVVYNSQNLNQYKILHPDGSLSQPGCYINQRGNGVKNGNIYNVASLLRRTNNLQIIKRDDNTVIIKDQQRKWIKFYQGTQYLIENDEIKIQKLNFPFVRCVNNQISLQIDNLMINGKQVDDNYQFIIQYKDGNQLVIHQSSVQITEKLSDIPYIANLQTKQFSISFNNEQLIISKQKSRYLKNNQQYDPEQNQQNFNENQSLPTDYIEPKLFIISSDNTGIQYLSEKQLQYYFSMKKGNSANIVTNIIDKNGDENTHFVSKVIQPSELNFKRINPNFNVNLDVFKAEKPIEQKYDIQRFTVRSLIKHKSLLPEDEENIFNIKSKHSVWSKNFKKQQNQFGHKAKGDPSIDEIKKDKQIMIDFRRKQLPRVEFDQLKQQAISQWANSKQQQQSRIAQRAQQDAVRKRLQKRKNSVIEQYPPLVIRQKQQNEQVQNYAPGQFYSHYFETAQGKKALAGMPQWIFRPKTPKQTKQLDPDIVSELNNTMNRKNQKTEQEEQRERYDTVQVALNPVRQVYIKPSVFTQRQIDEQRQAFQLQKKAYFYHQKKRKDFDIYGSQRRQKPQVKSLMRTQPISQINQKYLITQAPFDKKVKISSMKNKLSSQSSSLFQMRKQGPHNTLLKTIDKRNDYNQLLQKRTMMVHADLNDKLQRDILITPVQANFGYIRQGHTYQVKISVKNEDILAQRLVLKKPRSILSRVQMNEMGPIALGMARKITIQLKGEGLGRFTDQFEIVSKHQIYKIPIIATVLSDNQFQSQNVQLANGVKQVQVLKRKTPTLPPIN